MNDYRLTMGVEDKITPTLEKTKAALNNTVQAAEGLDKIRERFDNIQNSSKSLSTKLNATKKLMQELGQAGDTTSATFVQMGETARRYKEELEKVTKATNDLINAKKNMSWDDLKKMDFSNLDMKGFMSDVASKSGLGNIGPMLGAIATPAGAAAAGIGAVGAVMIGAGKAAADFEKHLDGLQALTGLSDGEMKAISDGALEMSKNFRASASDIVDAMKLIGSQAPELLEDKDALMEVTKQANVLAEAAGIDVVEAAKAITGTMNQMGVSADEAANIVNTFAAASQKGAADVAYLNKAFEKAGTAAASAGMDYGELAAVIETVGPKFSSADVAGSQLTSTLLKLSISGKDQFNPAVVGMSKALENLADAEMTDAELKGLVGESNITMIKTLIQGRDEFDKFNTSIRGTNTAYEQMAINNSNFEGAVNRIKSSWDAFLITLGQSSFIQGCVDDIMNIMDALGEVVDAISDVIKAFGAFGHTTKAGVVTIKAALAVLVGIIKGVGAAIEVVIYAVAKIFNWLKDVVLDVAEWIGDEWKKLKRNLGDVGFIRYIMDAFRKVMDKAAKMCKMIVSSWNYMKKCLGMPVQATVKITTKEEKETKSKEQKALTETTTEETKKVGGGISKSRAGKQEAPKTELELNREAFDKITKNARQAISDFNAGLISKKELNEAIKTANDYFVQNDIKAYIDIEYSIDKDGFEEATEIKDRKIGIELDREKIENVKKEVNQAMSDFNLGLISKEELEAAVQKANDYFKKNEIKANVELEYSNINGFENVAEKKIEAPLTELETKRKALSDANSKASQVKSDLGAGLINADEARKELASITEELQKVCPDLNIDLHVNDDGTITTALEDIENRAKKFDEVNGFIGTMGESFSQLGNAIGGAEGEIISFGGQVISQGAQMMQQLVQIIAANQAAALAKGMSSAAGLQFPFNLAAIATVVSTITSLFGALPKFASGGVISGSSLKGDQLLARVNAGEMILNGTQQKNLFDAIDNNRLGNGGMSGQVEFMIEGTNLKGTLRNKDNKIKKIR